MSFASFGFLIFAAVCLAGYYLIPRREQWVWLLIFSYLYYLTAGPALVVFLLFSTGVTFAGGKGAASGSKRAVALSLIANFGSLAILKYTPFVMENIRLIAGGNMPTWHVLLPLGISFYTFQTSGYVLDVYRGRCEAEESFLRYALFVSFFPQLLQGPIGRYDRLKKQLFAVHAPEIARLQHGLWRILWGFFKKMVIADNAAPFVTAVFDQYAANSAYALLGVLMYCAQLYADFSGGMDIVLGFSEMLGITLDENFRQPFFATSLSDFWHRWHITLGTWMKDYLFYPLSLSRWMGKFGKWGKKRLGKTIGRALPICVANIIVFLVVGIWHGPAWHFILYGLYNGLIIGISGLLAKPFRSAKQALGIDDKAAWFRIFQIIRTFAIVNISWCFDRSESVRQAFRMVGGMFRSPAFSTLIADPGNPVEGWFHFGAVAAGCALLFVISVLKERGKEPAVFLEKQGAWVRVALTLAMVLVLGVLGDHSGSGGFIYAAF